MNTNIKKLYINKITSQDIAWGTGKVTQTRAGQIVQLDEVNLSTLPVDDNTTFGESIAIVSKNIDSIKITAMDIQSVIDIANSIKSAIEVTTDPLKTSILNAENNAAIAQTSADNALASEQNAKNSETHTAILEQIVVNKEALVSPHYNSIDTVANNIGNVNTVATDIIKVNTYYDTYLGEYSSDPTTRRDTSALQVGDLYFNTADKEMRVYNSSGWVSISALLNGGQIDGDISFVKETEGIILTDRSDTSKKYRLFVNNGNLGVEEI